MLPLHTTIKTVAPVLCLVTAFNSCSSNSKNEPEVIQALNESVENSTKMLSIYTIDVMSSLRNKLEEDGSRERAKIWYPKAEKIHQLSNEIFDYIENGKRKINDTAINSSKLFEKLISYQKNILQVDPKITHEFQKTLGMIARSIDSSKGNREKLFENYFKSISPQSVTAILNKIQNNIRLNETRIIAYCNERCGVINLGPDTFISALVVMNSSIVPPNERIEITAGLGYFFKNFNTQVFVYDKPVEVNQDGFASYKLRAAAKSGKYYVPVRIKYIDQNSKENIIQKEIEYTVANIQKQ